MLVHINRRPISGPWGGGAHFINAFHQFADGSRDGVVLDKDITGRANPDTILLVGLENDMRGGISAEQAIMYQMAIKPSCKLVLRVNENDARKATRDIDEAWVKVSRYVDSTVFVSRWLQDYFNERGWACVDQHVICNGVQRGVFKPGTTTRVAPPAPGADTRHHRPSDPEEIKRELDKYLKPYLKA